jgi:hypothetical protein
VIWGWAEPIFAINVVFEALAGELRLGD